MSDHFVISRLCRDCIDGACVEACPIDCIYERKDTEHGLPNQLFIHPDECIGCGCCEPACPWEAIFEASMLPSAFEEDEAINAQTMERPELFDVAVRRLSSRPHPTAREVDANRRAWLSDTTTEEPAVADALGTPPPR